MIWGSLITNRQQSIPYYPKHYSAYSIIDRYKGIKQVFVFWYCFERRETRNYCGQLVAGYDLMPAQYKKKAALYIDRLFSQTEMVLLKKQIHGNYGFDIQFVAEPFPLNAESFLSHAYPEFLIDHKYMGKIDIRLPAMNSLNVKVRGVYDLRI